MCKSLSSILTLALLAGLVIPAAAAPIFLDDFNDDVGSLVGQVANTGQVWETGPWGGIETQTDVAYGQGGSVGAGITATEGFSDTWVDLGTVLTNGTYQLSADIKAGVATGERNLYLLTNPYLSGVNISFSWNGGNIGFEGVYAGRDPIPAGFSTGNIHIQLTFDLDSETGSVSWYDIDDPGDVSTSGNVDLGSFTVPLGVGNYAWARLLPFRGAGDVSGFDNVSLTVASAAVPGDFDGDGDVDGADFVAWQTHFPTASGATLADGDADGDGDVDGADFVVWQTNFPFTPSAGASPVPEPAAGGLALIALVALGFVSRRSCR